MRDDLPKGYAAAQALHAGIEYYDRMPGAKRWHEESNTVVILQASPAQLDRLSQRDDMVRFCEPDLYGALTAAAGVFEYTPDSKPFKGLSLL